MEIPAARILIQGDAKRSPVCKRCAREEEKKKGGTLRGALHLFIPTECGCHMLPRVGRKPNSPDCSVGRYNIRPSALEDGACQNAFSSAVAACGASKLREYLCVVVLRIAVCRVWGFRGEATLLGALFLLEFAAELCQGRERLEWRFKEELFLLYCAVL